MRGHRVVLAVIMGFGTFLVASVADAMLGAARAPSPAMTFVIVGAYLALCELLVARKGVEPRANVATLVGLAGPPVLMFFGIPLLFERHDVFLNQGVPGLLAGVLGPIAGAIAAWALPPKASLT